MRPVQWVRPTPSVKRRKGSRGRYDARARRDSGAGGARGTSRYRTDTLAGRELIWHDAAPAVGTEGDLILADLASGYAMIHRARSDYSLHVYFDYAVAFRFIVRLGGEPTWSAAVQPPNSSNTKSTIVTLETKA